MLGESPVWLGDRDGLIWVDSLRGRIRYLAGGELDLGEKIGSVAPLAGGGLIAALEHRVVALQGDRAVREICRLRLPTTHRLNDGAVDPYGRFVFGSMNEERDAPSAALYRLGFGGVEVLRDGLTLSNGIDWSPDATTIYFTDSTAKRIFAAEYPADGGLRNERVFAEWSGPGMPDGLAVDAAGHVWSAIWDGSCLVRFAPDGDLVGQVDLPVPRPTSLAFGGAGLRAVYVTSARVGLSRPALDRWPYSGALLVGTVDAGGLASRRVRELPEKPSTLDGAVNQDG
ncbi:SMP-30/gluconolactonase/LRE family protein [Polymorphospora sp. NPDC050346]|uniref:SMP-30/gluconolactonase/LRE family protein n=1 Tax=Polymorphospora sp. NPDC050346 TaxID=3155780 RepID=UPI0033D53432